MKKLTDETAAEKLTEAALGRFTDGHSHWSDDIEMMKVQTSDYLDLLKIAQLINLGETGKAFKKMADLDTEVRDDIPDDVWNHCEKI